MSAERDRIVEDVISLIRLDVQDLIYQGKDPEAVAKVVAHTMGSLRMLAHHLKDASASSRPHDLTRQDQQEIETVIESIPPDARPLFEAAILSGAHPLSFARRIQEMIVAAVEDPPDEPQDWGTGL